MHRLRQHRHWLARSLFGVLLLGWLSAVAGVCQAMSVSGTDARGGHVMAHRHDAPAMQHGCCEESADPCLHAGCVLKPAASTVEPQLLAAANLLTIVPRQFEPAVAAPHPVVRGAPVGADRSPPSRPPLHLQYCVFLD